MKTSNDFPFEKARRVSDKELRLARKAIAKKTGMPRPPRGRPVKPETEKYLSTSIRIHPKAMAWAKREAKRRGVGYQTVINAVLLEKAG